MLHQTGSSQCTTRAAVEAVVRDNRAKILAILVYRFGDLDLAEECFQDAVVKALDKWNEKKLPQHPVGWIVQTAQRQAIDTLRRKKSYSEKIYLINQLEVLVHKKEKDESIPDERLRLIFICCHPVLTRSAQIALCLKSLCGFSVRQIASAFLIKEATVAQRIVRAKNKIKRAGIAYEVPAPDCWKARLDAVLSVIYLIFNEGYHSASNRQAIDLDLCGEAIRLARVLVQLLPGEAEVAGLLALMYFHYARTPARLNEQGESINLKDQTRSRWLKPYIIAGDKLLKASLMKGPPGRYQIQAAISAIHDHAVSFEQTDWAQIALLYQRLYDYQPTAVVELNAAVALSFASGAKVGLVAIEAIQSNKALANYQPFYAAKADMLARAGQDNAAIACYTKAISLTENESDRVYLARQMEKLS